MVTNTSFLHKINHNQFMEAIIMSDLSAANCGCATNNMCGGGGNNNNCMLLLLLLTCCGGKDSGGGLFGNSGCGNNGCNNNSCDSLIWILLISSMCGGGGGLFC